MRYLSSTLFSHVGLFCLSVTITITMTIMMIIVISNNAATNVPLITAALFELSFLLDDATV